MPVFFLPPDAITPPSITVPQELVPHLRDSLRVEAGEQIVFSNGHGTRYLTEITQISKQGLIGKILETFQEPARRAPALVLGQALLKGEKMDWVIQKAAELGVQTIIPVQSRQSIVQLKADRIETQTARWRRIALEAAQQSEQWQVPTVATPLSLSSCIPMRPSYSLAVILAERRDHISTLASIELPSSPEASILVLVGPEGGWTEEEVATAEAAGCVPITLGPRILRAETAAITAIGILQHRLGELG